MQRVEYDEKSYVNHDCSGIGRKKEGSCPDLFMTVEIHARNTRTKSFVCSKVLFLKVRTCVKTRKNIAAFQHYFFLESLFHSFQFRVGLHISML
jgi:hypothetical protein